MKIIKEDQNLMILRDNHIFVYLVGMAFVLVGFLIIFKPDFIINKQPTWSGLLSVLLGGFVIYLSKITIIHLNKISNKLLFTIKGLTGSTTKEYMLDTIKEIELSVEYSSGKNNGYSYHLAFVLNNNEIVQFNPGSSSVTKIMGLQIIPEKVIGNKVANFLGVPFQERRPPTVNEILSTVSSAVKSSVEKEKEVGE